MGWQLVCFKVVCYISITFWCIIFRYKLIFTISLMTRMLWTMTCLKLFTFVLFIHLEKPNILALLLPVLNHIRLKVHSTLLNNSVKVSFCRFSQFVYDILIHTTFPCSIRLILSTLTPGLAADVA